MEIFETGILAMSRTVNDTIADSEKFAKEVMNALKKYVFCNWGDMSRGDKRLNDMAIRTGDRIFAAYNTSAGKIWIITEASRIYTTVMFPDEY